MTCDPALTNLYDELTQLPGGGPATAHDLSAGEIAVPLRLRTADTELSFISTLTTFGSAADVTLAELSIESFFPADQQTANAMRAYVPDGRESD